MGLKAMLENLDGLSDEIKKEYTEKDGKFVLDVTKVDGLGLENVDGLKSTVEKLRASEKTLQSEAKVADDALKAVQVSHKEFVTKYDGIDAVAAKEALDKIDDIKNWDGETKVKEAVQVALQQAGQKAQAKLDEVVSQNTTKTTELEKNLTDSQSQLQEAIVTSKIVEAISEEKGNVAVLMPHVRNQVVMVKDSHGTWKPEVQNKDGNPRVNGNGTDLTIVQLVQEMKAADTFASCFSGANSTGTDRQNSVNDNANNSNKDKPKVIAGSDSEAMSKNMDDIASGKVVVDMSK